MSRRPTGIDNATLAPWKPTRKQLEEAYGQKIGDVIAPGLKVLFSGINPGLYSGAVGHHFARPGNRFWPALHLGGFTPRVLSPFEESLLLPLGWGITNIVNHATATADQLAPEELVAGGKQLVRKVRKYQPAYVAFLGVGSYRTAFARKDAQLGLQGEKIGSSALWILPNPSGLNAHYQLPALGQLFRALRDAVEART